MSQSPFLWFLDSSALVKRYLDEPHSERVRRLARSQQIATCRLSFVEIASAIARRCREGSFEAIERDRALAALERDFAELYVVELTSEVTHESRILLNHYPLRASDAVQLASCVVLARELRLELGFLAYDRRLSDAARAQGLIVEL